MVKGPVNGSMAAYTYDSRNRLTKVLDLTYGYDAENNRIASTDDQTGKTIRYIHNTNSDLSQLLVEEDGTNTTKYVYGNELICAKTYEKNLEELKDDGAKATASTTYYYHYDNLKSTTLLTDESGKVVETYDYGTYGEVTRGDTTLTRFLYNGGLGVSSDSSGLYYMRARYYNPAIRRFINQDVETGSMDDSASLNRYAYVQGNPVSLTDPFGLSSDMELGNYEANALKRLFNVADKVADYLPVVGTARDIKRSYNAFKNGNIADGIKHGAIAALSLAGPAAKLASKGLKTAVKLAKNALKAEKCVSKTAQIASDGIKLARDVGKASKLAGKAGSVSAKIAKTVKNGVSTVARTVKKNAAKVFKNERQNIRGSYKRGSKTLQTGGRKIDYNAYIKRFDTIDIEYESIRIDTTDIAKIAQNTGMPEWKIRKIKEHLFFNEHILDSGIRRFDADPEIADGWYRLTKGNYNQNDIDLLNHEYYESKFESFFKTDYRTAHNKTEVSGRIWDPYKEGN